MSEPSVRGQNGGNARKEKLSPERRKEIGKLAAAKRWANKKAESDPTSPNYVSPEPPPINTSTIVDPPPQSYVTGYLQAPPSPSPPPVYAPLPPEPPKPIQKRRKPMVKEFGKAYYRAEKLLEEALKKRSEAVKIIIACNEDIPMYVNVIKSLGGTVDPQAMRAVDIRSLDGAAHIQSVNPYQIPPYQPPQTIPSQDINPIDPALYATNSNPLPGLAPAVANAPVVLNKPMGGAMDLDYVPKEEDEGPGLPKMGGGWQ